MKPLLPSLMAAAVLLAGCGTTPDPWMARQDHAAAASPGVRTLLRTHFALDEDCVPLPLPAIAIPEQRAAGVLSVEETVVSVPETGSACDGQSVAAVGIFFEPAADAAGIQTITYVELIDGPRPDRTHNLFVQVR